MFLLCLLEELEPEAGGHETVSGQAQHIVNKYANQLTQHLRFIGVSDIASVRFSLPSQLLEPRPNLEVGTLRSIPRING